MLRSSRAIALAGAVFAIAIAAADAAAAPPSVRIGSTPPRPSGSRVLGSLPGSSKLQLTVALQPRDPAALAAYATAVSTPGSAVYHGYLTVAQFRRRFAPTPATVAAVLASLRAHGLHPGTLSANGLSVSLGADAGTLARAFATSFDRVAVRGGRTAYANTRAPRVDGAVAGDVQAIIGLDSISRLRPLALAREAPRRGVRRTTNAATGSSVTPCTTAVKAASNQGAYTADQIATAYGFDGLYTAGDLGAGQTVALFELEPYLSTDISTYQSCYHTSASIKLVKVDQHVPIGTGRGEAALDIEDVIGLAPRANLMVYQGLNTNGGAYATYLKIITDDKASVISTSWGECESNLGPSAAQAEHTLFQEAAIQGQTVVAAAGDNGAQDCADPATHLPTTVAVDDPASQPFVTGVGGTRLTSATPPPTETVWNNDLGAGGGGDSALWTMPVYQSGAPASLHVINANSAAAVACGGSSGFCREVPDVSADADPNTGYIIYFTGPGSGSMPWGAIGGTSAAAPTWAAMFALANASAACAGSPIGFANPALYRAAAANYAGSFVDVKTGNNDWTASNGGVFAAGAGYDQASGLGTPIGTTLAPALCTDKVSVVSPGPQVTLAGTPASAQVLASDTSGQPITFAALGLPPGLSIDPQTGAISGAPTRPGNYVVAAVAADATGTTASATFSWTVQAATITVTRPGGQSGRVKATASLQIHASDNNGTPITYSATGLPRGLKLTGSTGRISGTLAAAGNSSVTVTASATGAPPASVNFRWSVSGPPTWSAASLSGIAAGRPTLRVRLAAGIDSPALQKISLKLPGGLGFARRASLVRKGIAVTVSGARRLSFTAQVRRGVLTITLRVANPHPRLAITAPAIHATRRLSGRVRAHHASPFAFTISVGDTAQLLTNLSLRLRPS